MKPIPDIAKLLQNKELTTKIQIFFSTLLADTDFDPFSKNYTQTELSPVTIRGLVREISAEALAWKHYGLTELGAIEVITDIRYYDWFKNCSKVIVDGKIYDVFKDATGNKAQIQKRSANTLRVVLQRR